MSNLGFIFGFSAALTLVGLLGVLLRKNIVLVLMSLEIMLLGGLLALLGASTHQNSPGVADGALSVIFVLVIAAAEVCVGLTLLMQIYKNKKTIWVDEIDTHA